MKRIAIPISLLLILALFTLACSLGGVTGGQGETPAAATPPGGATPAATTPPSGDEPTPVSGEEISHTSLGELGWINSYRYHFLMAWETLDEPKEANSMEMMWELVKDPAAQHFVMEGTGTTEEDFGQVEYIQIGDTAWMNMGDETGWMQMSAEESDFFEGGLFDLVGEAFLDEISGYSLVGDETVNGILCHHYVFDEMSLLMAAEMELGEVEQVNGEVWVSADDGFTVKYTLEADGKGLMGENEERPEHLSMMYELYDINADIVIEPPEGTGLPEDIPLMADAKVDMAMEGMLMYSTDSSVEDAVAFYQAEMPANGWTENPDAGFSMEGMASLEFAKDERTASLMISYDEDNQKTSVMISVE
jgi:hypothetical protein